MCGLLYRAAMLTTLATVLLLSAQPEVHDPAPPPLASATDGLRDDVKGEDVSLTSTGPGRVGGALLGTLLAFHATTAASTLAFFAIWGATGMQGLDFCFGSACTPSDRTGLNVAIGVGLAIDALGAVFLLPLGAWLGHERAGGHGSYGAAVAGGAIGVAVAAGLITAGALVLSTGASGNSGSGAGLVLMAVGAVAPFAGAIVGVELSHQASLTPRVGVAPARGGGAISLSWAI